jgi:capsular exopolysaccharide synthesis family protein
MINPLDRVLKVLRDRRSSRQILARLSDLRVVENPSQVNGHFAESFHNLKSNLLPRITEREKLFLITSVMPKEGKSTIAVNLARSLSTINRKVLLVDADLRQPAVHQILRISNRVGFANVLTGKVSLLEALQPTANGMVLTSGTVPPDPEDLLRSDRILRAVEDMRRNFDVVIMDAPPVLPFVDTTLLAAHLDGTILVLKYREVKKEQVALAKHRLESAGVKVIGCIINYLDDYDDELAEI